jgi:hypothetical protein
MARPKKPSAGESKSVYLSPEALDIIDRRGYQTNLSAFVDALIRNTSDNSPVIIAVKVERLGKEIAQLEEQLNARRVERDMHQAQLNLHKYSSDAKQAVRLSLLRRYDEIISRIGQLKGEPAFIGWLSGPANVGMVKDAGFGDIDEAVAWCKSQSGQGVKTL